MLRLRKFKEKKLKNNSLLVSAIILLGLMSSVVISKTYAIYKVEKKYDLIQAKIGDFRGKNQVISYYINNQESDVIPENKNYKVNVSCENATGVWNESKWKLELSNITKYTVKCTVNFKERYVIENAKSTNNSIIANYSNIENISSNYYLYGTDKNNLNQKSSDITNLNSDTTYYFKKCYEDNNEEICSDVSSLLTAGKVTNFDYTGGEQTYTTTCNGTYKLETWGAQGGEFTVLDIKFSGGYGGYSNGTISIKNGSKLYINVGQAGTYCTTTSNTTSCSARSSYNGGGSCSTLTGYNSYINGNYLGCGSGGGLTHVATMPGLLSSLSNNLSNILIVSGGGGGGSLSNYPYNCGSGGSSGGATGNARIKLCNDYNGSSGGTQESGNGFGQSYGSVGSGGGGGFYGGYGSIGGGAGGSSYIGNSLLTNKVMYCYNCEESTEESTKTISTTCTSATPTINCAKQGNGYARITIEECSI